MNVWARFIDNLISLEGEEMTEDLVARIIQWVEPVKKDEYHKGLREGARSELATIERDVEGRRRILEQQRREDEERRAQGWR